METVCRGSIFFQGKKKSTSSQTKKKRALVDIIPKRLTHICNQSTDFQKTGSKVGLQTTWMWETLSWGEVNWSRTEITDSELHNAAGTVAKSFLKVFWLVTYYNFSLSTWNYITASWTRSRSMGTMCFFGNCHWTSGTGRETVSKGASKTPQVYCICRNGPVVEFNSNHVEMREVFLFTWKAEGSGERLNRLQLFSPVVLWSALSGSPWESLCPILETQSQSKGKCALPQLHL